MLSSYLSFHHIRQITTTTLIFLVFLVISSLLRRLLFIQLMRCICILTLPKKFFPCFLQSTIFISSTVERKQIIPLNCPITRSRPSKRAWKDLDNSYQHLVSKVVGWQWSPTMSRHFIVLLSGWIGCFIVYPPWLYHSLMTLLWLTDSLTWYEAYHYRCSSE